jgi:hypothetical protein
MRKSFSMLMAKMDRGDALDEATFTAMETVMFLMRVEEARIERPGFEHHELLRQALAAARATVVVTGYALTTFADAERMSSVQRTQHENPAAP